MVRVASSRGNQFFLAFLDFIFGLFIGYLGGYLGIASLIKLWHGCAWAWHDGRWYVQLPVFYFSWVAALIAVIIAAILISCGALIWKDGWDAFKYAVFYPKPRGLGP
jgi:hypothetical protein